MMHFTVQTQHAQDSACVQCCCERVAFKPGTTNKLSVGYAPWAVPIGFLHCEPQFALEQKETCAPAMAGSNLPPAIPADPIVFETPLNTALNDNFGVTDPEGDPLTYKALPLFGPAHGTVQVSSNGQFTYTPAAGFVGIDRFFAGVADPSNAPVIFEVAVGVGGASVAGLQPTPHVSVDRKTIVVDQRYYNVSFGVKVSPAALPCEVWRLSVLQGALDCDCNCFTRTDCFDIGIVRC